MDTKLTITLPEELMRRAEALAAFRGETVADVVRDALKEYIPEAMGELQDVDAIREVESKIAAGKESISDWETFDVELDASLAKTRPGT